MAFALATLAKEANVKIIEQALEEALREKPLWFFRKIVMPLLPKETWAAVLSGREAHAGPEERIRHGAALQEERLVSGARLLGSRIRPHGAKLAGLLQAV